MSFIVHIRSEIPANEIAILSKAMSKRPGTSRRHMNGQVKKEPTGLRESSPYPPPKRDM
jgi:hypothetical protein